jgi:glycosyltransferase 2 family protein
MDSIRSFTDAVQAFGGRLAAVHWGFLAVAVAFSVSNLALRSRAWQQILRAALPAERIRYRTAFGAYCAGVGVNAIVPARVGDLVKMFLLKRSTRDAHYPTLIGSLVAETVFDFVVASALLGWALSAGQLPGLRLPDIPAFDLSWAFRNWWIVLVAVIALAAVGLVAGRRVRAFWRQFGQGLAILRRPGRYLRSVVPWQAAGWVCRVGGAWFFLRAFGVPASVEDALVVQVAGSLGALFPATPGGLGPTQALLVVMLAGEAGRTAILAFSAGMELTLTIVNVALGFTCMALVLRNLRFRKAIADARADQAAEPSPPG